MLEIEYKECYPEHIKLIDTGVFDPVELRTFLAEETQEHIFGQGLAKSAWVGVRPVAAAGLIPFYPGRRYVAWAIIGKNAGPHLRCITKEIRRFLEEFPAARIEMHVLSDFKEGHKWAKMLGFECETPNGMRKHSFYGKDEHMYARIK